MDKRKVTIATIVVIAIAAGAWALGFFGGTDPVVAEMQQLRDEMFANGDLSEADRRAQWEAYRQRMDGLTDAQRDALREGGRERWQQFGQQRMDEFFAMAPAEQTKRLDEFINRMLERQKNPNAGRGPGGPGGRDGDRGRDMTDAQRDQRRKERLDRTNPKMRAQFTEFRRRMDDRLKERGLPPMEGGPGRGGRGGPWRG